MCPWCPCDEEIAQPPCYSTSSWHIKSWYYACMSRRAPCPGGRLLLLTSHSISASTQPKLAALSSLAFSRHLRMSLGLRLFVARKSMCFMLFPRHIWQPFCEITAVFSSARCQWNLKERDKHSRDFSGISFFSIFLNKVSTEDWWSKCRPMT